MRVQCSGSEGQAHRVLTIEVGLIVGEKHIVVVGQQELTRGWNKCLSPRENSPLVSESITSRRFAFDS